MKHRLRMLFWDPSDDDIEAMVIDALEALPLRPFAISSVALPS